MGIPILVRQNIYIEMVSWKCEQNSKYFADDILKWISLKKKKKIILIQISLGFVPQGPVD